MTGTNLGVRSAASYAHEWDRSISLRNQSACKSDYRGWWCETVDDEEKLLCCEELVHNLERCHTSMYAEERRRPLDLRVMLKYPGSIVAKNCRRLLVLRGE